MDMNPLLRTRFWLVLGLALFFVLNIVLCIVIQNFSGVFECDELLPNAVQTFVVSEDADLSLHASGVIDHLIIVAGHGIFVGDSTNSLDEQAWILEPHQRNQVPFFVAHIQRGVTLAASEPNSLLVFSGGQTRAAAGPRSEAQTNYNLAQALNWWNHSVGNDSSLLQRVTTEEFARDSFENLLFSICRFYEVVHKYPLRITVISFAFKEYRFVHLHRHAIRFPASQMTFDSAGDTNSVVPQGELLGTRKTFQVDPFGCHPPLSTKRASRNPFHRQHGYSASCPHLQDLLAWCGNPQFNGSLPW